MDKKTLISDDKSEAATPQKPKRALSYYFTSGVIMGLLGSLADTVYRWLCEGLFGRIFTSYAKEQNKLSNGYLKGYLIGEGDAGEYIREVRRGLSERFESSFFVWLLKKLASELLSTPVRLYGNCFLSFGLYTIFAYFVRRFTEFFSSPDESMLIVGALLIICSIPLLTSKESLAKALMRSSALGTLLCDTFGFRQETLNIEPRATKLKANLSIVLGMATGALTFFISPLQIVLTVLAVVAIALVIASPEVGILISLFSFPFLSVFGNPSLALLAIVALTAVSCIIKLIQGKRILKFELVDISVLLFMVTMLLSGAISAGGRDSLNEALLGVSLIFIYFLIVNMMRTRAWIRKCILMLVSSATVVSAIGVFEYFFGDISTRWLDTKYFSDIKGRVVSVFDNPNVLAFYLVIIFPFALDLIFRCQSKKEKLFSIISASLIVLCTVFTWSRGAWLAMIVTSILYLLIRTRKTLKALFGVLLAIPALPIILPSNIINRFISIGDMSDSSTFYRVYTWKGAIKGALDNFWGGVGFGNSAFTRVYPQYAYAGIEAAEHSHNLFLQILFGMGIFGLLVFLFTIFVFAQKNFEYFKNSESVKSSGIISAAFCGFAAAMVMGMFDYVWYNYRIFFLFWVVVGISCAEIKVANAQKERQLTDKDNDVNSAQIDIF